MEVLLRRSYSLRGHIQTFEILESDWITRLKIDRQSLCIYFLNFKPCGGVRKHLKFSHFNLFLWTRRSKQRIFFPFLLMKTGDSQDLKWNPENRRQHVSRFLPVLFLPGILSCWAQPPTLLHPPSALSLSTSASPPLDGRCCARMG